MRTDKAKVSSYGKLTNDTLKDTDARSGMIHMNSNRMYFLVARRIAKLGVKSMESGHLYYIQIQIVPSLADNWIAIWTLFIIVLEILG